MDKILKTVSAHELVLTLFAHEYNEGKTSAEFFNFTAVTDAGAILRSRVDGTPNPYGKIYKHTTSTGLLKAKAQNVVNNALKKQGETELHYTPGELPKGREWVEVNGKKSKMLLYAPNTKNWLLRVTFANPLEKPEVRYFAEDGTELTYEQAKPYIKASKPTTVKVVNEATGETEKAEVALAFRDYGIHNIKEVRLAGVIYTVKD